MGPRTYLLELPSRAVLRQLEEFPKCLGPGARRWLTMSGLTADQPAYATLHEQGREEPIVRLVLDSGAGIPRFSPNGLHLLWGNPSGTVAVVDLVEVNHRLTGIGLGW